MGWILYSKRSIQNALDGKFSYSTDDIKQYDWWVECIYFLQVPVFWLMSFISLFGEFGELIVSNWTRGFVGFILRGVYWKTRLRSVGIDVFIDKGVSFSHPCNVEIGNNVHIDMNVIVNSKGKLVIGNNVQIASGVFINSNPFINIENNVTIGINCVIMGGGARMWHEGKFRPPCSLVKGHIDVLRGVIIREYAALSPGAKILPNVGSWRPPYDEITEKVYIGYACLIGANSFINDSVGDFEIWAGSPAKKLFDWRVIRDELSKTNDNVMEFYC